jgi:hypothetical protein
MYDRPHLTELIAAARGHIESQLIPAVKADPKLYFQTLVAVNVLKIAERQIALADEHISAEWTRLDGLDAVVLQRTVLPLPTGPRERAASILRRNRRLCEDITRGMFDKPQGRKLLFEHLLATTREQLLVANPKYLETVEAETATPDPS